MTDATARHAANETMSRAPKGSGAVAIDLAMPCTRWRRAVPDVERVAREAAGAALARARKERRAAELSLVLADDALVAALNERWRHVAGPTNVLAFPGEERAAPLLLLGDVVLAYETVAREAQDQGKTLADHLRHLVIHGVLHLLGHGHDTSLLARRMEALETRILASLGVPDPYRARQGAHG